MPTGGRSSWPRARAVDGGVVGGLQKGGGPARATQINHPCYALPMHDSAGVRAVRTAAVAAAAAAVAVAAAAAALPAEWGGGAWAQTADTPPTLGVILADTPPHHYKDGAGRTVVVGQVVNNNGFAVSGVKVWVGFYGASGGEPIATAVGTTLIGVVPAGATAPFAIPSESANAAISDASVTVLGFNYADEKPQSLRVEVGRGGEGRLYASEPACSGRDRVERGAVRRAGRGGRYDPHDPVRRVRPAAAPSACVGSP